MCTPKAMWKPARLIISRPTQTGRSPFSALTHTGTAHPPFTPVIVVFLVDFSFPFRRAMGRLSSAATAPWINIEIRNNGDETGFIIQIEAVTDATVPEVAAVTPTIYNADTGEYMQIKGEILRGDIITISTKNRQ